MKLTKDTVKNFERYLEFDNNMKNKDDEILEID